MMIRNRERRAVFKICDELGSPNEGACFRSNVRVVLITPPPRLFCAGVSWGRVWRQGGNNKPLAVSGDCSTSSTSSNSSNNLIVIVVLVVVVVVAAAGVVVVVVVVIVVILVILVME